MLGLTLAKLGYQVVEAANGHEALERQQTEPAVVMVTDLIMPDMEGIETIQEFHSRHPAVKIIAMSGGGRANAVDFLKVASVFGAARTLAKPFAISDLAAAIIELLPAGDPAVKAAQRGDRPAPTRSPPGK
jgi:DNA-binding NtrC family response regulator